MFNSNQAFILVQMLKSALKDFTLGVKAEIEKNFSICPKVLINAELYGCVLVPRLKKENHPIWEANFGPMFPHLLTS